MNGLIPIEHNNQRILLTSQLAEMYGTESTIISNNFNRNFDRYKQDEDYFCLENEEKRDFVNRHQFDDGCKKAAKLYLWTEHGALLHAKSLGTDRAWGVYGELVDTYFRAREQARFEYDTLSPELRALINIELTQKRQEKAIAATNERLDHIGDLITLNPNAWRDECRGIIVKIAQKMGGNEYIREVQTEIFKLVNTRAGVSLETRLTNMKRRMADEGVCKSKRDKLNKVDVIAEDKKLIEIYIAIVKEMAVKYSAADTVKSV